MSEVYCPGGSREPTEVRNRDLPARSGQGVCPECGDWFKLTPGGVMRRHTVTVADDAHVDEQAARVAGFFQPADEDLNLPPEDAAPSEGMPPPTGAKTNPTPDLTDAEYLEQMALIAQAISVMPAQREGLPNVTTPPPIRPLWAKFMLSLGVRIVPELATHKLKSTAPAAAGNFGPREHVPLKRQSMNRDDLMQTWKDMNPESFQGIQSGTMTREALLANMPEQMQEAVRRLEELQAEEAAEKPPEVPPQ